jgi:hypothetical protein
MECHRRAARAWFVLAISGAAGLWGQQQATLTGTLTDASGALVPGAAVVLTNEQTGESYRTVSNQAGNYTIPFIKPGDYLLQVEAAGFKAYRQTGLRLETAAHARQNAKLEVGQITESVTVEAEVPQLKTENSSVAMVVQNKTIANMPLINRRAAQLVRMSGFVVQTGNGSSFQIAGGRSDNAMWTLDGGSTQNILLGVASLNYDPPIEALEEMNVEVSNYKAEMGRSGGGFIQMTTKSGTNNFHGALYEFLRNDAMDSRQFFAADKQTLRRNQFGWALGGPIRKDRTFFFASQEFTRQITANPRIENIPNPEELRGDFSNLRFTLRDPVTRQPVPGNIIPASQIDPVAAKVVQFFPAPNIGGRPSRNQNYIANARNTNPNNTLSVRLDHTLNDRHRLFGRYVHSLSNNTEGEGIWPNQVHDLARNVENAYYNWSVTGISNVRPTLIAEYRYTGNWRKFHPTMPSQGKGLAAQIGFKGGDSNFFPGFGFTGGIQRIGRGGGQERRQFPIKDSHWATNWTWIKGAHTIKWGGEFRASQNDDENLPTAGGAMSFNNNATGDPIAALLYGWVASGSREQTLLIRSRANSMGGYIQDDWKVNRRLTLNIGLRYDLDTPRFEKIDNRQNSFDVGKVNPVCNCPGTLTWSGRDARGGSKYAHNFVPKNFGPRLGLAYRVTDKTVIRAGASLVYTGQYDQATPIVANAGFSIQGSFGTLRPTDAAFRLRDGLPAIDQPSEKDLVPSFGAVAVGRAPVFSPQFFQPEGRPNPYLITYNFNIQRQLANDILFEVGYLSTLGRKLTIPGTATLNQIHPNLIQQVDQGVAAQVLRPFPQFNGVSMVAPTWGSSAYQGVNFRLEKRYTKGLLFNMNYTFARALDNVEGRNELGGEDGNAPFSDQYNRKLAWGLGGSHIKHRYIVSALWDIPWGTGRAHRFANPVLNQVAGGWTLGTIIEARSGPPFSVYWGNASQIYPTAARVRADVVGTYSENANWRGNVRGESFFDRSAFAQPARFTFGTSGRNNLIGPGALRADLSVIKHIAMPWENHTLQFRGEVINFPNRANFGLPSSNLQAGNFGSVTGLTNGASGRIIQLGLRYGF